MVQKLFARKDASGRYAIPLDDARFSVGSGGLTDHREIQNIIAAGAIDPTILNVTLVGPASSTYAVTLAAPDAAQQGDIMVIAMTSTTASDAVTMALTEVVGGSAATSASFNAAGETLVLVAGHLKWIVLKEIGVTLS